MLNLRILWGVGPSMRSRSNIHLIEAYEHFLPVAQEAALLNTGFRY